jgi:Flp pilus assembly secretin CpaC
MFLSLGNLFKSTQFQKQETELVFLVTASLVKPVNRDDLPSMHGIDGLKNGSPLGLEPKVMASRGASGFTTGPGNATPAVTPAEAPKKATPATAQLVPSIPAEKAKSDQGAVNSLLV